MASDGLLWFGGCVIQRPPPWTHRRRRACKKSPCLPCWELRLGPRNRLKALYWHGSGLWVSAKRLERGRFSWPQDAGLHATLRAEELNALLNGLEIRARKDWHRS